MDLIEKYLQEKIQNNNSKQTYRKFLKALKVSTKKDLPNKAQFSAIALYYRDTHAPKTYSTFLSVCKNFFNWCVEDDLINKTPYKSSLEVKKPENQTKKVWLTVDELKKIRLHSKNNLQPPQKLWVDLMMHLGLRGIELTRLKVEDLKQINDVYCLAIQGKGKSENKKDIRKLTSDSLVKELQDYIKDTNRKETDFIFLTKHKNQYQSTDLSRFFKQLYFDALRRREDGLTMHSIRHSVAVSLLKAGQSIQEVATLLRHSSTETTKIYSDRIEQEEALKRVTSEDTMGNLLGD